MTLSFSICLAQAQTAISPDRFATLQKRMANVKQEAISKLSPRLQNALSGGALNFLQFATAWQNIEQSFGEGPDSQARLANLAATWQNRNRSAARIVSSGPVPVSNPADDFTFSLEAGFTQSETSTAWCGSGVVVGFNDSGSVFESELFGPGGLSFSGAGASTDGGNTFHDIGYINPGSNPLNFLEGDPVVNCADERTFYYSQIGASGTADGSPTSVIFLSKSTDGGFTWENPIPAVSKDATTHMLDKDWSAVDPKNPKDIYVSYTDFDLSLTTCPNAERIGIEVVHSSDGGATWSTPTVVSEVCSSAPNLPFVQGSQIVVDWRGRVYVEWEVFPTGFVGDTRELRIARSTNYAESFGASSKIADAIATGDGFALQGNFRTFLTGNLTIDRSEAKSEGDLYITWEDGRFRSRIDLESPFGLYRNANVLISRSSDGGAIWSPPVRVNTDPLESSKGFGIDHFQPGVAVDSKGTVAACWYDRRVDPLNYRLSRFCGLSTNHGDDWVNARVDPRRWPPIHATDAFINVNYLGDYDTVASDKVKASTGFQGAYGDVDVYAPVPNQDVFLVHVNK